MFQYLLNTPFVFYHFCWNTPDNCIRWNIFSHHCTRGYYCPATNIDAREQSNITTDPNILIYNNILIKTFRLVAFGYLSYIFPDNICMIPCMYS